MRTESASFSDVADRTVRDRTGGPKRPPTSGSRHSPVLGRAESLHTDQGLVATCT